MTTRSAITFPKFLAFLALAGCGHAQPLRVYVATLDEHSVTLAWGRASGHAQNTIGYAAPSAPAVVRIAGRELHAGKSWLHVDGLQPDTSYPYSVEVGGAPAGSGTVRTWAARADSLTFIVMGDWGEANTRQYALARRLEAERLAREKSGHPVRFVLSAGDNIYSGGHQDADWERRFFAPYEDTLRAIPFYAVLGNHDGNESERTGDLAVYLDNFFFPGLKPARWYKFQYGGLAEFFALDSTKNQPQDPAAPVYRPGDEQSRWLEESLRQPALPWRLVVVHHPLFSAGPRHEPKLRELRHWLDAWREHGVSAVFSGHEHNLQISERSEATGNIQFVVSGAGGSLRKGNVRSRLKREHIAAWAPQVHFMVVEIERDTMRLTPVGYAPLNLRDADGREVPLPIVVPRRH